MKATKDQLVQRNKELESENGALAIALHFLATGEKPDGAARWSETDGDGKYLLRLFGAARASGGIVAEGICFSNGKVALHWLSHLGAVNVYDSMDVTVVMHGHDGRTVVQSWSGETRERRHGAGESGSGSWSVA